MDYLLNLGIILFISLSTKVRISLTESPPIPTLPKEDPPFAVLSVDVAHGGPGTHTKVNLTYRCDELTHITWIKGGSMFSSLPLELYSGYSVSTTVYDIEVCTDGTADNNCTDECMLKEHCKTPNCTSRFKVQCDETNADNDECESDINLECEPGTRKCILEHQENCTAGSEELCALADQSNCSVAIDKVCASTLRIHRLDKREKIMVVLDASTDTRLITESNNIDLGLKYEAFLDATLFRVPGKTSVKKPPLIVMQPAMRMHYEVGQDVSLAWDFLTAGELNFVVVRELFQFDVNVTIKILYEVLHDDFPQGEFGEVTFHDNILVMRCNQHLPGGTQEWNIELHIANAQARDEGVYSLTYMSPLGGMTTLTSSLIMGTKIYPFPEWSVRFFVMDMQNTMEPDQDRLFIKRGEENSIICRALGYGVSHVELLRKNKLVVSYGTNTIVLLKDYYFPGIGFYLGSPSRKEAGRYVCRAYTHYGRHKDRIILLRVRP